MRCWHQIKELKLSKWRYEYLPAIFSDREMYIHIISKTNTKPSVPITFKVGPDRQVNEAWVSIRNNVRTTIHRLVLVNPVLQKNSAVRRTTCLQLWLYEWRSALRRWLPSAFGAEKVPEQVKRMLRSVCLVGICVDPPSHKHILICSQYNESGLLMLIRTIPTYNYVRFLRTANYAKSA